MILQTEELSQVDTSDKRYDQYNYLSKIQTKQG